jgi:hypothetical protein
MPRVLLLFAGLLLFTSAALLCAGCLDDMPVPPRSNAAKAAADHHPSRVIAAASIPDDSPSADAGEAPDLLPPPPPDLAPSDLTGLVSCYGKTYCDVASMFCLRFIDGSPGKPGPEKVAPSCYTPQDPCPNGTLDCNCIQQDAVLGPACAECFDNKDGTITCYAQ